MTRGFPITAYSACNGLGRDTQTVLDGLFAGRRGLSPVPPQFSIAGWVGRVPGELAPLPPELAAYDTAQARMCQLALADLLDPVRAACARWGAERVGLVMATSTGGIAATEAAVATWKHEGRIPPEFSLDRHHAIHGALPVVTALTGVQGPAYVVSTACSSSAKVFASARRLLLADVVDAVVVGGVDTLARMTLHGFHSLGVLSAQPCRPFSAERTGINIGEGGAFALLEREGEARGRLLGVGESSDAHHMTQPHPEGRGARDAMARALEQAGVAPAEVDHVNAHATGTQQNDAGESRAILDLLGPEVPVVATKGYTGHMLGAAGATEVVFSIAAIERGRLPASLGADPVDAGLGVAVNLQPCDRISRHVLSNSLAFGGSNVSVLIGGAT